LSDDIADMKPFIKVTLGLQAFSVLWFLYIEATSGDPGTALGWVFFQFLLAPFVVLALLIAAMRWLMEPRRRSY
jgi:hypothetical protein